MDLKLNLCPELQIRGGTEDNSKITFLFLNKNIHCDPSLEQSWQDFSNEGQQGMFLWSSKESYPCYPFLSGSLCFCGLSRCTTTMLWFCCFYKADNLSAVSGPICSKLMMSLINEALNFQT